MHSNLISISNFPINLKISGKSKKAKKNPSTVISKNSGWPNLVRVLHSKAGSSARQPWNLLRVERKNSLQKSSHLPWSSSSAGKSASIRKVLPKSILKIRKSLPMPQKFTNLVALTAACKNKNFLPRLLIFAIRKVYFLRSISRKTPSKFQSISVLMKIRIHHPAPAYPKADRWNFYYSNYR